MRTLDEPLGELKLADLADDLTLADLLGNAVQNVGRVE